MFALLEHTTDEGVHWDLLIEVPGRERLPTWRLAQDPLGSEAAIRAEALADHRRLYLEYEGPVSGGRGQVRRVDRGPAMIEEFDPPLLRAQLAGRRLRGRCRIVGDASGQLWFTRQRPGDQSQAADAPNRG